MSTKTHIKTTFRKVTIPQLVVNRGEDGSDTISGAVIAVPFSTCKLDAVAKALDIHRKAYGIPTSVTIRPTVTTVPLMVGTTMPSASRMARFHGKIIEG